MCFSASLDVVGNKVPLLKMRSSEVLLLSVPNNPSIGPFNVGGRFKTKLNIPLVILVVNVTPDENDNRSESLASLSSAYEDI